MPLHDTGGITSKAMMERRYPSIWTSLRATIALPSIDLQRKGSDPRFLFNIAAIVQVKTLPLPPPSYPPPFPLPPHPPPPSLSLSFPSPVPT